MLKKLTAAGDTIVEVMVVLAILGLAISIAYATANRSLLNARQAQENSRASELAQSQLERIYANASVNDHGSPQYVYQTTPFCIDDSGNVLLIPPSPCQFDNQQYSIKTTYYAVDTGIGPARIVKDTFVVVVTWDDVLGQGPDTVTLSYRTHPTP
jgi:type II secretory pathway pseudopilin PulG